MATLSLGPNLEKPGGPHNLVAVADWCLYGRGLVSILRGLWMLPPLRSLGWPGRVGDKSPQLQSGLPHTTTARTALGQLRKSMPTFEQGKYWNIFIPQQVICCEN